MRNEKDDKNENFSAALLPDEKYYRLVCLKAISKDRKFSYIFRHFK